MSLFFDELWNNVTCWFSTCHWYFWFPCGQNSGFGGTSFISFSVAFNVAIAKSEVVRKSFVEALEGLKKHYEDELKEALKNSILADDKLRKKADLVIQRKTGEEAEKIYDKLQKRWDKCRIPALICAILGALFLFFQLSIGLLGLILYVCPARIWWVTDRARLQIGKKVRDSKDEVTSTLNTFQKLEMEDLAEEVQETLNKAQST